MKFGVSITYKDLFDDHEAVNVKELLADIPTQNAVPLITYFLAQIHIEEHDEKLQIELINFWAQRLPNEIKHKVYNFIKTTIANKNSEFIFISNLSGLNFIETIIENHNSLEEVSDLTPAQELNFFKAYLIATQTWIDKQGKILFNIEPFKTEMDFVKTYAPSHIGIDEFYLTKDFRTQFLKAKYFFQFCEAHQEFKTYLDIFLKEYGLDSWKTYLKNLLSLYIRKFERLKTPSVVSIKLENTEALNFLNQLSIDVNSFSKSEDFLQIREKPIYKLNETDFAFLNLNFFVDKIYQGIQFDFASVLAKNAATFKGKPIKSRVQFLSIFGDEFSETELFYKVMEECFKKSGYIIKTGTQIKEFITEGEPDYYIRDKNKVYIFEFKNVFLAGPIKHSYDFETLKAGIYEKLVVNNNGTDKGVRQLCNTINKIRKNQFNLFDDFDFDNAIIYPVIVYTDSAFGTAGVNFMLNREFKECLEERNINATNVNKLTMIDLDDFLKFQDLFRNKSIKLNNLLNGFHEFIIGHNNFLDRFTTFNIFIENKTRKMKSDLSKKTMDEIVTVLDIK